MHCHEEILTDVLQVLVPRLFIPQKLRVTLVTLYRGPQTPGDSILTVSLRYLRGVPPAECRVARPPVGDLFSSLRSLVRAVIPARDFCRLNIIV